MSQLFNRYCEVRLGNRVITAPPFSIEFDQTFKSGTIGSTILKLYNPSFDTIKAAESTKSGKTWVHPEVTIDAGYDDDYGTCVLGYAVSHSVKQQGPDKILEVKITDATNNWSNAIIGKTYQNMKASAIVDNVLVELGINSKNLEYGTDLTYNKITVKSFKYFLKRMAKDTDSTFSFKNGILEIKPKTQSREIEIYLLSNASGLLDAPEKTLRGLKIKTLFFYNILPMDVVRVVSNEYDGFFKIFRGTKKFSSFGNATCNFEVIEI